MVSSAFKWFICLAFPLIFAQPQDVAEAPSNSWIIPLVLPGKNLASLEKTQDEGPWLTLEYFAKPDGAPLHSEVAEKVWWLQDQPVLLLGSSGNPLPPEVIQRATAWVQLFHEGVPLGKPIAIEPRAQGLAVQPNPEAVGESLRKRLGSSNAAYLSQVANFLAKNTSVFNAEANSYQVTGQGTVINSAGEWTGEPVPPFTRTFFNPPLFTTLDSVGIGINFFTVGQVGALGVGDGLSIENQTSSSYLSGYLNLENRDGVESLGLGFYKIENGVGRRDDVLLMDSENYSVGVGILPETKFQVYEFGADSSLTDHGLFLLGRTDSANITMDNNELIARNNGNPATLFLQDGGGNIEYRSSKHTYDVGTTRDLILEGRTANSPYLRPSEGGFGWLGDATYNWFRIYTSNIYRDNEFTLSDRKVKKGIADLDRPLELLGRLRGVRYEIDPAKHPFYKNGSEQPLTHKRRMGFVAQEFAEVFPDMVTADEATGLLAIRNQEELLPVLVEAVKAQQALIEKLEKRLAVLEAADQ